MRWFSIAILLIAMIGFVPAKPAQAADFAFSLGFHNELSPYGTWVSYSNYGNCWRPYAYSGWRPYTDGYWGYTSYGPTWYGNEAYASYVYHYGYWIYSAQYGWIWVPGYDWSPGRVTWSYGGGYIGWRPMFPSGYYYPGNDYNLWTVISVDRFGDRSYRPYALRATAVRDLFDRRVFRTRQATFRRADLERVVRRPLRVLNVRERDVRIGNRRARLLVTPEEEVRIRKHVTQVRGGHEEKRKVVERTQITRHDNDHGTKSKSTMVRKTEKKPTHITQKSTVSSHKTEKVSGKAKISSKDIGKGTHETKSKSTTVRKTEKKPSHITKKSTVSSHRTDRVSGKAKISSGDHRKKAQVTKSKKKVARKPHHRY